MENKISKSFIGGITGTLVMTAVMMIAPKMGIPKMSPPAMLSMMMGLPIIVGWFMHFMIGIIFALIYAFFFFNILKKINNNLLKGAIFGLASFIFAQIAIGIMDAMIGGMPAMEGSMILMMIGSIMGHVIFGMVVTQFVKESK
ncbi:MAG: hypothetical protein PSX36_15470 [bacterium]|nr:hypothetical protein [bacterium]